MSAATQTAIAHPIPSSHASHPSGTHRMGFLRRHLGGHKRRSSSISFPNGTPGTPVKPATPQSRELKTDRTTLTATAANKAAPTPAASSAAIATDAVNPDANAQSPPAVTASDSSAVATTSPLASPLSETPTINIRRPSETTAAPTQHTRTVSGESGLTIGSNSSRAMSPRGVRWAPGFDGESADEASNRLRRLSSGTGRARRSSIYARSADGVYDEGVETGVGSKARNLSVLIPKAFEVDECALEKYFSFIERKRKKQIGEGGAAAVFQMHCKSVKMSQRKDTVVAVKEFRPWEPDQESNEEYRRKIKSEYAIAKSLNHPNIVETYQLCIEKGDRWYHVMDYCDVGDLNDAINEGFFSREDRDCLFKQLLRGVQYLHSRGIAHRDIKSENLLIAPNSCLKIADFGTSEVFSGDHPGLRRCRRPSLIQGDAEIRLCKPGLVGSKPYMAPELLRHVDDYDPRAIDMWSCAIVYITLIVGGTPWESAEISVKNFNQYCFTWDNYIAKFPDGKLSEDRPLPLWATTKGFAALGDVETKRLILGMMHPDPKNRTMATEALESKTVTEFPCCQQDGYSDDIRTRQRKALHNHIPPLKRKKIAKV